MIWLHMIWLHRSGWPDDKILQAAQQWGIGDNQPVSQSRRPEEARNAGTGYMSAGEPFVWKLMKVQNKDLFFIKPTAAKSETF